MVGATLENPARVTVTGSNGQPLVGTRIVWSATGGGAPSSAESTTDASGTAMTRWTLGTAAGTQTLIGRIAGLSSVVFTAEATPDRPAAIRFDREAASTRILGDTLRIAAHVTDRYGNPVIGAPTLSLEPGSNAITLSGNLVVARSRGVAVVRAAIDTVVNRLPIAVDPPTPTLTRVSPDTATPGTPIVIEGEGFAMTSDVVEVMVGGVRATVTSASPTRLEFALPASLPCSATAAQTLRVTVGDRAASTTIPVRTATRVQLGRGQSANVLDADRTRCTEIVAPAGTTRAKYVFAVINTSATSASVSGFELKGTGAGAMSGQIAVPMTASSMIASSTPNALSLGAALPARLSAALDAERSAADEHATEIASARELNARYGSPAPVWRALRATSTMRDASMTRDAEIGDTIVVKALYTSCSRGSEVRARVVYAGTRALVLEDVAAPRPGQSDAQYRAIGDEFDRVQYPLLQNEIGDPLAMNGTMGGDGRVTMLFTRYVNDSLPGIQGYVTACNFYPKGTFAGSNEDEIFYARVPVAGESAEEWRRSMRSTIIHEAKHLASFAERFSRGTAFEESWLEEATARVAEELYSRTFANGGAWKSNIGFTSVRCEVMQCDARPLMMWKHFSVLYQYMRGVDTLTPIGAATSTDYTYYASGWSLVRWAADQYATNEGSWLRELVRGSAGAATGLANLAARTGRPAGDMLADWALANAVDDAPGFTPERRELTFPSWNTNDVMNGLATSYPTSFVASPLKARAMSFGSFNLSVPKLRAFSSSYFTFEGAQSGSQLIELMGAGGLGAAPANLRVAVVRVE